jgi:hypothetical protein
LEGHRDGHQTQLLDATPVEIRTDIMKIKIPSMLRLFGLGFLPGRETT